MSAETSGGGSPNIPPHEWKFFLGACLLAGALVMPHAGVTVVLEGMALAAGIFTLWSWLGPSS